MKKHSMTNSPVKEGSRPLKMKSLFAPVMLFVMTIFLTCPIFSLTLPASAGEVSGERALSFLKDVQDVADSLEDYTVTLMKWERIDGELLPEETIFMKWKKPSSVYMKFVKGKHEGREVIYVRGENDDKMFVSPDGFLSALTLQIAPGSDRAMKDNRHSVEEAGLPDIISQIITFLEKDLSRPDPELMVEFDADKDRKGEKCVYISIENGSYATKTNLYFNKETLLPVHIISFTESGEILESYKYNGFKTNVGFDDDDFDPDNEEYNF